MEFTIKMGDYYFSITYFDIPDGFRRYFRGSRRAALRVFCPDLHRLMLSGAEPTGSSLWRKGAARAEKASDKLVGNEVDTTLSKIG